MAQTESKPDVPEQDSKSKEQQALADAGLGDHRTLTTADVPAILALAKSSTPRKRASSSSSKSNSKSRSKS